MIESLMYMLGFVISIMAIILMVYMITRIAPQIAEIKAAAETRQTRIEARADLAMGAGGFDEQEESSGSEYDSIARMFGYDSVGSAISDPNLLSRLGLGNKKTEEIDK